MLIYRQIILFSVPEYALTIGLSSHQASIVGAITNLGMAVGRPFVGFLCDKLGRINVVAAATFLCGLFTLCIWTFAKSYAALLVFSLLSGTVCGTYWAVSSAYLSTRSKLILRRLSDLCFQRLWVSRFYPQRCQFCGPQLSSLGYLPSPLPSTCGWMVVLDISVCNSSLALCSSVVRCA
jgi:MFS family permease